MSAPADFETVRMWFNRAGAKASQLGKVDSAVLWKDGLSHLDLMRSENDRLKSDKQKCLTQIGIFAGRIGELKAILQRYVNAYPAFRIKPIGADGSPKRLEQEMLMALEDAAKAVLAVSTRERMGGK